MKKKIVFSLLIFFGFFFCVEIIARQWISPKKARVHVYSGTKARENWFELKNYQVSAQYQHRPTGSFSSNMQQPRIAFLGGSSVHGGSNHLSARQEFPALVGQKMRIQTLNLGNPSLDSHDLSKILTELKLFPMSAWVVYTGHNDFGNTYFHQRYKGWSSTLGAHALVFLQRLAVYQALQEKLTIPSGNTAKPNPKKQFSGPYITEDQKIRAQMYFEQNIEHMIHLAKQEEIPIVFVIPIRDLLRAPLGGCHGEPCALTLYDQGIALREKSEKEAISLLREASDADEIPIRTLSSAQEFLRSQQQTGVYVIDLPKILETEGSLFSSSLFQDHVHLTGEGHQKVADVVSQALSNILERK